MPGTTLSTEMKAIVKITDKQIKKYEGHSYIVIDYKMCCCCCEVASVMSDSVRPHRQQPIRLLCPWDSPGKNTGVGRHFLFPACLRPR